MCSHFFAQQNKLQQQEGVHQVVQGNNNHAPPPTPQGRNIYHDPDVCCVVFVTKPRDRQSMYRRSMEVNIVIPAIPKYMLWSEQEITWSFKDHPKVMPNPGGYALVVDPIMHGASSRVRFSKVLVDNGSNINIMYQHTLHTLGITENMLEPSRMTFHGIVRGLSCSPMGKVRVDVLFGGRDNCRVENILFEVVDLDSPYHALLGRSTLAKFMASIYTAYLKMKMLAPNGPLNVVGNYKVSLETTRKIIGEEVTKLLVSGFIIEVLHTEWLANPVLVEKKKEDPKAPKAWRMCIDYTHLNKACPKDPFPLPRIDQRPVYYLSEVLSLSKQNYPHYQKMTYGVYMATTKPKHYFEEHPMTVVCEAPISEIISNKDASGRIAKWAIQLSPYVPRYERRDEIKSHALADFLVDWAEMQYKLPPPEMEYWRMHFDGSNLKEGLGAGVVLTSLKGDNLRYVLQIHFRASNNVAEYEALVHGLKVAKEVGVCRIISYGDSDLVVQQCSGDWDAKDSNMASYRFYVQRIAGYFEGIGRLTAVVISDERGLLARRGLGSGELTGGRRSSARERGGVVEGGEAPGTGGVSWGGSNRRRASAVAHGSGGEIEWLWWTIEEGRWSRRSSEMREARWCEGNGRGSAPFIVSERGQGQGHGEVAHGAGVTER
ncbi:hypothetical protein QYE76_048129 [Lolium multiflorum]|uniref:RNase H type-1 domain-containing protein n=1 Tax=Lolium multiflorum TaxID=4521 RepID=A0AAD8PNQ2_LOLMU|nr:hypothetical protein QYE76_048129 [Lolium multiflorum]